MKTSVNRNAKWCTYFDLHGLRGPAKNQDQESDSGKCGLHGDRWQRFVLQPLSVISCYGCTRQVLSSVSASPWSTSLLLNSSAPQPNGHVIKGATNGSFSHGLMSSNGVLQGCKREFINHTLTSSLVWLFLWIPGSLFCSDLQDLSHLSWVKELPCVPLMTMKPHQSIVRKSYYSHP